MLVPHFVRLSYRWGALYGDDYVAAIYKSTQTIKFFEGMSFGKLYTNYGISTYLFFRTFPLLIR